MSGEFLQAIGRSASQEGIGTLLEFDAVLTDAVRQPMVLIEADTVENGKYLQMRTNIRPSSGH